MKDLYQEEGSCRIAETLLSIEVTTHCNIECRHCFVNHQISERSSLPFDVVRDIIEEGYDCGFRRLHLTGGEPLLWKGLFDALDFAFFIGFQTVLINTNGILLSENLCARLSTYADLTLTVSLDGPAEHHDRMRGRGAYRRTMQGIENAANEAVETVIFTSLHKSLLAEVPYFVEELYSKFPKIKYLSLIPLRKAGAGGFALCDELLDPADFVRLVRTVSLLNVLGFKVDVLNEPLVRVASTVLQCPFICWPQPLQQDGSIIIMADRTMGPSHFSRSFLGLYEPGSIQKALTSNKYRTSVMQNETVCPCCNYHRICRDSGMLQPSELNDGFGQNELYCRRVLDAIARKV